MGVASDQLAAKAKEQMEKIKRHEIKSLTVRGDVIMRWSLHLDKVYRERCVEGVRLADDCVQRAWAAFGHGVPENLLQTAIGAETDELAAEIASDLRAQQEGYAAAR